MPWLFYITVRPKIAKRLQREKMSYWSHPIDRNFYRSNQQRLQRLASRLQAVMVLLLGNLSSFHLLCWINYVRRVLNDMYVLIRFFYGSKNLSLCSSSSSKRRRKSKDQRKSSAGSSGAPATTGASAGATTGSLGSTLEIVDETSGDAGGEPSHKWDR